VSIVVRPVARPDAAAWLSMRRTLWPSGSSEEHREEIERFLVGDAKEPLAVVIAADPDGRPIGFAELSIRPHAEGCRTDRVAYLEGWFVAVEARGRGVGRLLVRAAEAWALAQGCDELASDSAENDAASRGAHRAVGFEETGLVRCYRRDLEAPSLEPEAGRGYRPRHDRPKGEEP
jgi:aminoglycoside 6'-N-acetyltransferase I